jgi:excisionase family DNA binding protein
MKDQRPKVRQLCRRLTLITGNDGMSPLLSIEDVAKLLNVRVSWVYERTRQRSIERIPGFRLGKYWRFREEDVLQWIERQGVGRKPNV